MPVEELWDVPLAEARRRMGISEGGVAADFYREIRVPTALAEDLRQEWRRFGVSR
jgi:hypothetical protein